jgi:DNA invertase Pin-like site-specific DNA recombinase
VLTDVRDTLPRAQAIFLLGLEKAGVEFLAADMPHADRIAVGDVAFVAEEEARLTSACTKAALAAARASGVELSGAFHALGVPGGTSAAPRPG